MSTIEVPCVMEFRLRRMLLAIAIFAFLPLLASPLNVALHAQASFKRSGLVVGSEVTCAGLKRAFEALPHPAAPSPSTTVEIFSPFNYDALSLHQWDIVVIEGWFTQIHAFIHEVRRLSDDGSPPIVLFVAAAIPGLGDNFTSEREGMEALSTLEVDGFLTNSERLRAALIETGAPAAAMLLAVDDALFRPLPPVARYAHNVTYVGHAMGLVMKPHLRAMLRAALPQGLVIYGAGWGADAEFATAWGGVLPPGDLAALYSSAKVVLGSTNEDQARFGMVNNRAFEAVACGAALLFEHFDELEAAFGATMDYARRDAEGGVGASTATRVEAMLRLDGGARIARRDAAAAFIRDHHTWAHRVQQIVRFVDELHAAKKQEQRRRGPVVAVLWESDNDGRQGGSSDAPTEQLCSSGGSGGVAPDHLCATVERMLRAVAPVYRIVRLDLNAPRGVSVERLRWGFDHVVVVSRIGGRADALARRAVAGNDDGHAKSARDSGGSDAAWKRRPWKQRAQFALLLQGTVKVAALRADPTRLHHYDVVFTKVDAQRDALLPYHSTLQHAFGVGCNVAPTSQGERRFERLFVAARFDAAMLPRVRAAASAPGEYGLALLEGAAAVLSSGITTMDASSWGGSEWCDAVGSAKHIEFIGSSVGNKVVDFDTKLWLASLAAMLSSEVSFDGAAPLSGVDDELAPSRSSQTVGGAPNQIVRLPLWDTNYYARQFRLGMARMLCTCCGGAKVQVVSPRDGEIIRVESGTHEVNITVAIDVRDFSVPRDGAICLFVNRTGTLIVPEMVADHCVHYSQLSTVYTTTLRVPFLIAPHSNVSPQRVALAAALTSNIYSDRIRWSSTVTMSLATSCASSGSCDAASASASASAAATLTAVELTEEEDEEGDNDDDATGDVVAIRVGRALVDVPLSMFNADGTSDAAALASVAATVCEQGSDQLGILSHRCPWVAAGELLEALTRDGRDDMAADSIWRIDEALHRELIALKEKHVDVVVAPDGRSGDYRLRRCLEALVGSVDQLAAYRIRLHIYVILSESERAMKAPPRAWLFHLVKSRFDITLVRSSSSSSESAEPSTRAWIDSFRAGANAGVAPTVVVLSESAVVTGKWLASLWSCVHGQSSGASRMCIAAPAEAAVRRSGAAASADAQYSREVVAERLWRRAAHDAALTSAAAARSGLCIALKRSDLDSARELSLPIYADDASFVFDGAQCELSSRDCSRTAILNTSGGGGGAAAGAAAPLLDAALVRSGNRSVMFVLHDAVPSAGAPGGGLMATMQVAESLAARGTIVRIAALHEAVPILAEQFPAIAARKLLVGFSRESIETELVPMLGEFHVAVATFFPTVWIVRKALRRFPALSGIYFVQDYEPLFPLPAAYSSAAKFSYALTSVAPRMKIVSYSDWIRRELLEKHGVASAKVTAAVDHSRFTVDLDDDHHREKDSSGGAVVIAAMVRPSTPRRAATQTVAVLAALATRLGDAVAIRTFGCTLAALSAECVGGSCAGDTFGRRHRHLGELDRDGVATALRESDIFIDLSHWQAFGFTGLEAMASGAVPLLTNRGGVGEYARHGENALLVDTTNFDRVVELAAGLAVDSPRRARMSAAALATASVFTLDRVAASWRVALDDATRTQRERLHAIDIF